MAGRSTCASHSMVSTRRLHRGNEGHLVLRTAPALASRQFAAQVGVINLHPSVQLPRSIPLTHHVHQLVFDQPGGLVTHAQMALGFEGRDVVLGLGQQVHAQEPGGQRQLGGLEDRAAHHRRLFPAHCTLSTASRSTPCGQRCNAASRHIQDKRIRSASAEQRPLRGFHLGSVPLHELRHRQALRKLYFVDSHRASPSLKTRPLFTPAGSPDAPAELCGKSGRRKTPPLRRTTTPSPRRLARVNP
jgi:hypothetical protein